MLMNVILCGFFMFLYLFWWLCWVVIIQNQNDTKLLKDDCWEKCHSLLHIKFVMLLEKLAWHFKCVVLY